jgi:hypothetical protein
VVCGLCRYNLKDEALVRSDLVRKEITRAFAEQRAFSFQPDAGIISELKNGAPLSQFNDRFIEMKNRVFETIADGDSSQLERMMSDTRLSQRITNVMYYLHLALGVAIIPPLRVAALCRYQRSFPAIHFEYHISDGRPLLFPTAVSVALAGNSHRLSGTQDF